MRIENLLHPSGCKMSSKTLHSDCSLYFICKNEPKPDNENWATVICEEEKRGKAVSAYISPFDAMVDAILRHDDFNLYRAIPSTGFDLSQFVVDNNGQLAVSFQIGWAASNGRILLRPAGNFAACSLSARSPIHNDERIIHFSIPKLARLMHARARDLSGAKGWAQSIERFHESLPFQQEKIIVQALREILGITPSGTDCNEIAFYDLDQSKWKFVNLKLFDDLYSEI